MHDVMASKFARVGESLMYMHVNIQQAISLLPPWLLTLSPRAMNMKGYGQDILISTEIVPGPQSGIHESFDKFYSATFKDN